MAILFGKKRIAITIGARMFVLLPMPVAVITLAAAIFWGSVITAGAMTFQVLQQRSIAKKAASTAKKVAGMQAAAQGEYAGEYFDLSKRQMELQSQQRQIDTLADLIKTKGEKAPIVLTTPPTKEYSVVEQFNLAIEKLFRG